MRTSLVDFCVPFYHSWLFKMMSRPTAGVTGAGAGVDSVWEQIKLEARKMLAVGAARREAAVPSVQCTLCWVAFFSKSQYLVEYENPYHHRNEPFLVFYLQNANQHNSADLGNAHTPEPFDGRPADRERDLWLCQDPGTHLSTARLVGQSGILRLLCRRGWNEERRFSFVFLIRLSQAQFQFKFFKESQEKKMSRDQTQEHVKGQKC